MTEEELQKIENDYINIISKEITWKNPEIESPQNVIMILINEIRRLNGSKSCKKLGSCSGKCKKKLSSEDTVIDHPVIKE